MDKFLTYHFYFADRVLYHHLFNEPAWLEIALVAVALEANL